MQSNADPENLENSQRLWFFLYISIQVNSSLSLTSRYLSTVIKRTFLIFSLPQSEAGSCKSSEATEAVARGKKHRRREEEKLIKEGKKDFGHNR